MGIFDVFREGAKPTSPKPALPGLPAPKGSLPAFPASRVQSKDIFSAWSAKPPAAFQAALPQEPSVPARQGFTLTPSPAARQAFESAAAARPVESMAWHPSAGMLLERLPEMFDIPAMVGHVHRNRMGMDCRDGFCSMPLVRIVRPDEELHLAANAFFDIPSHVMASYFDHMPPHQAEEAYEAEVLWPAFEALSAAFNMTDHGLPGWFQAEEAPDGGVDLVYVEEMPGARMAGLLDAFEAFHSGKKPAPKKPDVPRIEQKPGSTLPVKLQPKSKSMNPFEASFEKMTLPPPVQKGALAPFEAAFQKMAPSSPPPPPPPPPAQEIFPAAPREISPFEAWSAAPPPADITQALVPKGEAGSLFVPEKEIFSVDPAPPPAPRRKGSEEDEEEEEFPPGMPERPRGKIKTPWKPPSAEFVEKRIRDIFDLREFWDAISEDRHKDTGFLEDLERNDNEFGEGARIELQTVAYEEDPKSFIEQIFDFFGLDASEISEYLEWWEEEEFDYGEAHDALIEEVVFPLYGVISEAFDRSKPGDIPGHIGIEGYHDGLTNIVYLERQEDTDPEELDIMLREVRADNLKREQRNRELQEERDRTIRFMVGDWKVPSADQMAAFMEKKFDLEDLFRQIRKARKSKAWRLQVDDRGEGDFPIEDYGPEMDPDSAGRAALGIGVPHEVVARSAQLLDDHEMLWQNVVQPADDAVVAAFERLLPKDLPGAVNVYTDDDGNIVLGYHEYVE